jgi:hypothetical protein
MIGHAHIGTSSEFSRVTIPVPMSIRKIPPATNGAPKKDMQPPPERISRISGETCFME